VCKKLIKNSQSFGKKFQKTVGGGFFLTHTVYSAISHKSISIVTSISRTRSSSMCAERHRCSQPVHAVRQAMNSRRSEKARRPSNMTTDNPARPTWRGSLIVQESRNLPGVEADFDFLVQSTKKRKLYFPPKQKMAETVNKRLSYR